MLTNQVNPCLQFATLTTTEFMWLLPEAFDCKICYHSRNKKDVAVSKRSSYFEMDAHQSLELKKVLEAHETIVHCSHPVILSKFLKTDSEAPKVHLSNRLQVD